MNKRESIVLGVGLLFLPVSLYFIAIFFGFTFGVFQPRAEEPIPPNISARLAAFEAQRRAAWATTFNGWEILYDGVGTTSGDLKGCDPSSPIVPRHLHWDAPANKDDPRHVSVAGAKLNWPTCGFFSVDRVTDQADAALTGQFFRKDEFWTYATGLTAEVRVRLGANSVGKSVSLDLMDGTSFIRVTFEVGGVAFESGVLEDPQDQGLLYPIDTTVFHTYRVVRLPNDTTTNLYVDGALVSQGGATTNLIPELQGDYYGFDKPVISFGDHGYAQNVAKGHYVLDYIKYRRGAFAPSQTLTAIPTRIPPLLPPNAPASETFYSGFDGTFLPTYPAYQGIYQLGGLPNAFKLLGGGLVEYDGKLYGGGAGGGGSVQISNVPALVNRNGVTIEARIKVLPDSGDRAFPITFIDQMGAGSFVLSYGKAETFLGIEGAGGYSTVTVPNPADFHTYRFVRKPNDLYAYLYIDNDPVPVIADQRLDGSSFLQPYLQFGYLNYPVPGATGHVVIDHIRWHDGAYAPPLPTIPIVDLECTSDGAQTFIQGPCSSAAAILRWQLVPNATSCSASAVPASTRWQGARPISGTESVEVLTAPRTYTLTCVGTGGTSSDSVTVNPPTTSIAPTPTPTPTQITCFPGSADPNCPTEAPSPVLGDIDRDGDVDIFDYNRLVSRFGQTGSFPEDIDGNRRVDIFDYNFLVMGFGR